MVKLTLANDDSVYVNPDHVVSVQANYPRPALVGDSPIAVLCAIQLRDEDAAWLVKGPVEDIVGKLEGNHG